MGPLFLITIVGITRGLPPSLSPSIPLDRRGSSGLLCVFQTGTILCEKSEEEDKWKFFIIK